MNGKSFILSAIMVMLLIPTACTNNTDWESSNAKITMLTLTSQIAATRCSNTSLQGTQLVQGVKIGALAYANNTCVIDNHPLTADGTGNFTGNTISFSSGISSANITAYAPYNNKWISGSTSYDFSISTDQSTEEGYLNSDLLWGESQNVALGEDAKANITFSHKLAKLQVSITRSDYSTLSLINAKVSILGAKTQTTFTPSTGILGEASNNTTEILIAKLTDNGTGNMAAIIIPQTITAKKNFLKIELASGRIFYVKLNKETAFESGKSYKISVQLEANSQEDITVNIKEENEINGLLG